MDKLEVTTLNEDGSIAFKGSLNKDQAGFIIGVGISFLLAQGAAVISEDDDDDDDVPEANAPSTDSLQ